MKKVIFGGNSGKSSNKKKVSLLCQPAIRYLKRLITLLGNAFSAFHEWRIYVTYVSMYLKLKYLPAKWLIRHAKSTMALTVTTNSWYILWHVRLALSSMSVVLQIVSDILGTIINVIAENMQEVRLVCKNVFLNILIMKGIVGSYMTFQLRWSIKLMQNIYQTRTLLVTYPQNVGTSWS